MDSEGEGGRRECGLPWTYIKHFHHRYLLDIPNNFEDKVSNCSMEFPYPIFNPVDVSNNKMFKKIFKSNIKGNTRLEYYKKLYAKEDKKKLKAFLEEEFVLLPQYIIDVAEGVFDECHDPVWCYTGGTLRCFSIRDQTYVARAVLNGAVQITNLDCPNLSTDIEVDEYGFVYNLKSLPYDEGVLLAVRQKYKIVMFYLKGSDNGLTEYDFWSTKSANKTFVDMAFNEYNYSEFLVINDINKLEAIDLATSKRHLRHKLPSNSHSLNDKLVQIVYVDRNNVCYMTRSKMCLLDLRSRAIKELNLSKGLFKCDDFCTVSKSLVNENSLLVSSIHSCMDFDIRGKNCTSKIKHMLSNAPFLSNLFKNNGYEYVCLFGQNIADRVILHNSVKGLTLPLYVPNTKDSLTAASLINNIQPRDELELRMTSPALGMELYRDSTSNEIFLYSATSIGDVFKQKLIEGTSRDTTTNLDEIYKWSNLLSYKSKKVEATSICNLGHVMSAITTRLPKDKVLKDFMKENNSVKLFEKDFSDLGQCLEGAVGEAMNSIWDDEMPVDTEDDVSPEVSSTQKVSNWLSKIM